MPLTTVITAPVVSAAQLPTAAFVPNPAFGVVGSVVKLDARLSSDPDQKPLIYTWRFVSVPIGSQVQGEGFRTLDIDSATNSPSQVSFSPDVVGQYVLGLKVSNGVFESEEVMQNITIRAILIPHGQGIIPDGKFIWSFIRDVWSQVEGREFFETLWSALIQITGAELLKLYQVDFNKSIRDIQDHFQQRWLSYEPKLLLDNIAHSPNPLTFYLGNHCTGHDASTVNLGLEGQAIILSEDEIVVVLGTRLQNVAGETFSILYSIGGANNGSFELQGLNGTRTGYKLVSPDLDPVNDRIAEDIQWKFEIGSVNWELVGTTGSTSTQFATLYSERAPLSDTLLPFFTSPGGGGGSAGDIKKGDVIHYPVGPNAGFYRIVEKAGSFVTVDHAPPSFSTELSAPLSKIYRPVGFKVTQPAQATTNTFSVPYTPGANDISVLAPGRLVVVNGQAHTIVRSVVDKNQLVPSVIVTVDSDTLLAGLRNLNWRAPATAISTTQEFEALGLSTGDLLGIDVVLKGSDLVSTIVGQVVGVHGNSFGLVFTDEPLEAGELPTIPAKTIQKLANDFGIDGVSVAQDGSLVLTGTAKTYSDIINSGQFKRRYWNTPLTPDSIISVNPDFQIRPSFVIRNRLIPVDENLRSVPTLQEWITQPVISERNGKLFQSVRGKEFELTRRPVVLTENLEYIVDDEFAFVGEMIINTGSSLITADDADFADRSMAPGDEFIISSPLTLAGTYVIKKVISNNEIELNRPVPSFVLGPTATARVTLKRKKTGHFLRFVPGQFTAQNPAPDRLWAEVSFFDNNPTIENNFGILVGLKRETLETVSRDINYRQAVSGLMFAFTSGSDMDSVRLGAQILLGLPFAEHKGIIRSIEEDYRLDVNGVPILGRLLIEDVDSTGKALGTLRIYTYPVDEVSELAGLDVNPATGKLYAVGDTVELFAPLCKGVEIIDYITNPLDSNFSAIAQLQKYHTVRLRANDNIFSLEELGLVSDFLRKITPSYIAFSLTTASEFADVVNIVDLLFFKLGFGEDTLVDNASLGLAPTLMFDSKSADGIPQIAWEDGVYSVRRYGTDLVTVNGSTSVSSAAGGFINPKAHEEFEAPLVRAVDFLIIFSGINKGVYLIGSVTNDTTVLLTGDAPPLGFEAATDQPFAIIRRTSFQSPLLAATAAVTNGNPTVDLSGPPTPQLRTRGIMPGDWLIIADATTSRRHIIRQVQESAPGVWSRLDVTPNVSFATGSYLGLIFRPSLLPSNSFQVDSTGVPTLDITANPQLSGLLSIGDELVLDTPAKDRVTVLDPVNMYVSPTPPVGTYSVTIAFKDRCSTIIGWDHIEKYDPIDVAEIALVESQALADCTNGSDIVTLEVERTTAPTSGPDPYDPQAGGVRPGDLLVLTSGANAAVDVGHGPGVYPIVEVSPTDVRLSVDLTNTETDSWKIVRRR
jgi:hypothetical protein